MEREFELNSLNLVQGWGASGEPDVFTYLGHGLGAEGVLACSALFWPQLVSHQGGVFLKQFFLPENFSQWRTKLKGDISQIEKIINHVHLWDFFDEQVNPLPDSGLRDLATIISETWNCCLKVNFPSRDFLVDLSLDDDREYGPTITFYSR